MVSRVHEADLSQRTIRWILEQIASFYNGRYDSENDIRTDNQRLEKKTVLLGYVLMTIFQIQQSEPNEFESEAEIFLRKLIGKSIFQEAIKIANHLEKMIREKESSADYLKNP